MNEHSGVPVKLYEFQMIFHLSSNYNSLDSFSQLFKNVDSILCSRVVQKQLAARCGLWAIACRPLLERIQSPKWLQNHKSGLLSVWAQAHLWVPPPSAFISLRTDLLNPGREPGPEGYQEDL